MEVTLGKFDEQVMLGKKVVHIMHSHDIIGDRRTSADDDVIHIDSDYHSM